MIFGSHFDESFGYPSPWERVFPAYLKVIFVKACYLIILNFELAQIQSVWVDI